MGLTNSLTDVDSDLVEAVTAFLRRMAQIVAAVPERSWTDYQLPTPGEVPGQTVSRPARLPTPVRQVFPFFSLMREWSEVDAIVKLIREREGIWGLFKGLVNAPSDEHVANAIKTMYLPQSLLRLSNAYLEEVWANSTLVDEPLIAHAAETFVQSLVQNRCRTRYLAPLYNTHLIGVHQDVEIAPGYCLIIPDDRTWGRILDAVAAPFGFPYIGGLPYLFLERQVDEPSIAVTSSHSGNLTEDARNGFDTCAVGLRLALGGHATIWDIVPVREPFAFTGFGFTRMASAQPPVPSWASPWDIDRADEVRAGIRQAQSLRAAFPVGFRRFRGLSERANAEDRVIDVCIALENILLPNIVDEVRFRFALRGARLLAPDSGSSRRDVFRQLKHLYDIRSKLVHGEDVSDEVALVAEAGEKLLVSVVKAFADHSEALGGQLDRRRWAEHLAMLELGATGD